MRRDLWIAAIQMWRDNFWWGAGPAHFNYRYPAYRPARIQMQPDRAHNDYLNLLADWGTTGGIITLAGMAVFGAGLWRTRNHVRRMEKEFTSGHSNRFAFFIGAAAGLLALAVHSVVDFNLHIPGQRDPRSHVACAVEQQPALCHGNLLVQPPPAAEAAGDPCHRRRNILSERAGIPSWQGNPLAHPRGAVCRLFHPNAPPPWKRPLPPSRKIFRRPTTSANVTARKVSTAGKTTSRSRRPRWDGFHAA